MNVDEIEKRFLADQDDGQDIRWLIDRVKVLTEALEFYNKFVAREMTPGIVCMPAEVDIYIRNALSVTGL